MRASHDNPCGELGCKEKDQQSVNQNTDLSLIAELKFFCVTTNQLCGTGCFDDTVLVSGAGIVTQKPGFCSWSSFALYVLFWTWMYHHKSPSFGLGWELLLSRQTPVWLTNGPEPWPWKVSPWSPKSDEDAQIHYITSLSDIRKRERERKKFTVAVGREREHLY